MKKLLLILLLVPALAHAGSWFQYEAGIGVSKYQDNGDDFWYQAGFPHQLDLTSPAYEVGITGNIIQRSHWGVDWHADYVWLGMVHTQATVTPVDDNYNQVTRQCNGPCDPMATDTGSGHDQGFILTAEPHIDYSGVKLGFEVGPYLHRASWSVLVQNDFNVPGGTIDLQHQPKWLVGYVAGVSVSYRNFTLAYQYFRNQKKNNDPEPPIWQDAQMLVLKYRF